MAPPEFSSSRTSGEHVLDARNLHCPLPVLKARKRLARLPKGAVLRVIATDPASQIDMAHFCNEQGHALLSQERIGGEFVFRIERK
jgi:tRNA 2-thiouridine synthesizing protein A